MTKNENAVALGTAQVIIGAGIIGLVLATTYYTLSELATFFVYILLPICLLLLGVGLIGNGLYEAIAALVNGDKQFTDRVKKHMESLRAEAH